MTTMKGHWRNHLSLLSILWTVCVCGTQAQSTDSIGRYAAHSVLAEGHWVKMRIPETGFYQITDSLAKQAGFADAAHVSVWGYGGALQPEVMTDDYLRATDDLKPVPSYYTNGRRFFHATGPVNWESRDDELHTRNFYSSYGYYFLTKAAASDGATELADSTALVQAHYPGPNDYHALYEVDDYSWYMSGRNLFDAQRFGINVSHEYQLPAYSENGSLTLRLSYNRDFKALLFVNDSLVGKLAPGSGQMSSQTGKPIDSYSIAEQYAWSFDIKNVLKAQNTITITQTEGSVLRLDFMSLRSKSPRPMPALSSGTLPQPELAGLVTPQDRHGDPQADMVIIVPTSRKLLQQAERLKQLHEEHDSLRVNLVVADELYNEFSSGTPSGNAYRRYMKMLYDRAETAADRPRYLLLMGDGAWDNRMLVSDWRGADPDDYLLCYESENSLNETKSYVTDDYFCLLDDGDGGNILRADLLDAAVGRLPVVTEAEAEGVVNKIIAYAKNEHPGSWQNLLCFMGDDGNNNMHMIHSNNTSDFVRSTYPEYYVQKVMWDTYERNKSVYGVRYPEVSRLIQQNMQNGALVMNYTGHGKAEYFSHEYVVSTTEFETLQTNGPALWVTASCDIIPFDRQKRSIGEIGILNPNGGAIGFLGTGRTVYAYHNQFMNRLFMKHVLATPNGRLNTMGEALQFAKNELITTGLDLTENKFQYILLGDPALQLAAPRLTASIDSIDGQPANGAFLTLKAGSRVNVAGSVPGHDDFNGDLAVMVFDGEQNIVCRLNDETQADSAFVFQDRQNIIYRGNHQVQDGHFNFTFTVTQDLLYTPEAGQLLVYAASSDHLLTAHGQNTNFCLGAADYTETDDETGPEITCYLNSPDFENGDPVEQQPMFVAELYDANGINSSGSSIGHDLELVIDKRIAYTYYLNDQFMSADGDNSRGSLHFQLPVLSPGMHTLRFRAWDMLNNSSTVTLTFNVTDPTGIYRPEMEPDDENGQGAFFDTAGRRLNGRASMRNGLYIYRDAHGNTKKMMHNRQ